MESTAQAIQILRGIVGLINNQDLTIDGLENMVNDLKSDNTTTKAQLANTIATYENALAALKQEYEEKFAADEAEDEKALQEQQDKVAKLEGDLAETRSEKEALEAQNAELAAEVANFKAVLDRIVLPQSGGDTPASEQPTVETPSSEEPVPSDSAPVEEPAKSEPDSSDTPVVEEPVAEDQPIE